MYKTQKLIYLLFILIFMKNYNANSIQCQDKTIEEKILFNQVAGKITIKSDGYSVLKQREKYKVNKEIAGDVILIDGTLLVQHKIIGDVYLISSKVNISKNAHIAGKVFSINSVVENHSKNEIIKHETDFEIKTVLIIGKSTNQYSGGKYNGKLHNDNSWEIFIK